jgi:hypothetical protein
MELRSKIVSPFERRESRRFIFLAKGLDIVSIRFQVEHVGQETIGAVYPSLGEHPG